MKEENKKTGKLKATQLIFIRNTINSFLEPSLEVMSKLDTIEKKIEEFMEEEKDKIKLGEDFDTKLSQNVFKEFTWEELEGMTAKLSLVRADRKYLHNILLKK